MSLSISIKDLGTIRALIDLQKATSDLRPALSRAGTYMERETRLNFAKEQSPDGDAWAGLAASTLRQKKTSAILRETGTLVGSVAKQQVTAKSVTVGASTAYGIYHQTGTSKMPARPFIGIAERHKPEIKRIIVEHIQKAL